MKYVLNERNGEFVLIPDFMRHSDIPGGWTHAGFVNFDTTKRDDCGNVIVTLICFGESISLGLKSRGEADSKIIMRGIVDFW